MELNQSLINFFTLSENPAVKMSLFSPWHIAYMLIILSFPIICFLCTRKTSAQAKNRVLSIFAIAIAAVYFGDFFLQPFYDNGALIIDKLPFHACTFLCPAILFAQFSKNRALAWLYDGLALVAIVTSMMYFTYPNTAFGDNYTPWCYQVLQTFLYHGLVYSWGMYALLSGRVRYSYRVLVKVLAVLTTITTWATIGNYAYGYNWYFLNGLDLGFIKIEDPYTYIAINVSIFLVATIILSIARLVLFIRVRLSRKEKKHTD